MLLPPFLAHARLALRGSPLHSVSPVGDKLSFNNRLYSCPRLNRGGRMSVGQKGGFLNMVF